MTTNEVFADTAARVVELPVLNGMDMTPVIIADQKIVEGNKWVVALNKQKLTENQNELTIPCPSSVLGVFIGKGGRNINRIIYHLAQHGLSVRKIHFEEVKNA